jgi:hypothetical protein
VVLVASPSTRHARIQGKARGGPVNRQLASTAPGDATWQRAERVLEEVLEVTGRSRVVLTVSTEGAVEKAVARVDAAVAGLVGAGG